MSTLYSVPYSVLASADDAYGVGDYPRTWITDSEYLPFRGFNEMTEDPAFEPYWSIPVEIPPYFVVEKATLKLTLAAAYAFDTQVKVQVLDWWDDVAVDPMSDPPDVLAEIDNVTIPGGNVNDVISVDVTTLVRAAIEAPGYTCPGRICIRFVPPDNEPERRVLAWDGAGVNYPRGTIEISGQILQTIKSGDANDGSVWFGGETAEEIATRLGEYPQILVHAGHKVTYSENEFWRAETAPQVDIRGKVHVRRGVTVRLSCGDVIVRKGGVFLVDGKYLTEALNWHTAPDNWSQGRVILGEHGELRDVHGDPGQETRDLTIQVGAVGGQTVIEL